uniref:Ig-like domain-containing protein n=1 Tax=Xiphophorus maculatus TaxID=8083 RepID=A0A3B5QQ17_XIPMA
IIWMLSFKMFLQHLVKNLGCQRMESIPSSSVVKKPGETLSLSCRGSGFTFTDYVMHWIRQPAEKGLEWIGRGFSDNSRNTYASSVRGRIEISREDSNSMTHLRLSNLKPEDSAVYYCARLYKNYMKYIFMTAWRGQKRISDTNTHRQMQMKLYIT